MDEPLILEVADHRGRVRFRTHLDPTQPQTLVGRALRNQVVLDDPYVDACHLRITVTEDGRWRFADLGSVNGVWLGLSGIRSGEGAITAGLELKIGRSMLRFVSPDAPVAPALPDPARRAGIASRLLEPRTVVAVLGLAVGFSAMSRYYASTRAVTVVDLATPGLTILIFSALWASAWAFTNRLVAHRFRFLAHLAWAALVVTFGSALAIGREWLGFFLPAADLGALDVVTWWAAGALLLVGHFELITEWPRTKQWTVAAVTTGAVAAVVVVLGRSESLGGDRVRSNETGALKPIAVRYLPATSLEGFARDAAELKSKVDAPESSPSDPSPDQASEPDRR